MLLSWCNTLLTFDSLTSSWDAHIKISATYFTVLDFSRSKMVHKQLVILWAAVQFLFGTCCFGGVFFCQHRRSTVEVYGPISHPISRTSKSLVLGLEFLFFGSYCVHKRWHIRWRENYELRWLRNESDGWFLASIPFFLHSTAHSYHSEAYHVCHLQNSERVSPSCSCILPCRLFLQILSSWSPRILDELQARVR